MDAEPKSEKHPSKILVIDLGGTQVKILATGQTEKRQAPSPFLYVSGFANAVGKFMEEVTPNEYGQNFVAAHNAAVALAWILPELVQSL